MRVRCAVSVAGVSHSGQTGAGSAAQSAECHCQVYSLQSTVYTLQSTHYTLHGSLYTRPCDGELHSSMSPPLLVSSLLLSSVLLAAGEKLCEEE